MRLRDLVPGPVLAARRRVVRSRLSMDDLWRRELPTEVAYWDKVLATRGLDSPAYFERSLDPTAPIVDPALAAAIDAVARDVVDVVDVGAGPLPSTGKRHDGKELRIVATDALGSAYDELLARHRIEPPLRTVACRGEDLIAHFGPARFDVAYARNSVDHSADPVAVVRAMAGVVRPGGVVLLRHYVNEAVNEHYEELHQWNFELRDGRPVVWNRRATHDLTVVLGDLVALEDARIEPNPAAGAHADWLVVVLRRREPGPGGKASTGIEPV